MFERFIDEEEAQGAIEYILLAGGIIVAAVVIFAIYSRMTKGAAEAMNRSVANATAAMENRVLREVANQIQ